MLGQKHMKSEEDRDPSKSLPLIAMQKTKFAVPVAAVGVAGARPAPKTASCSLSMGALTGSSNAELPHSKAVASRKGMHMSARIQNVFLPF
jgi:hypothetical protein